MEPQTHATKVKLLKSAGIVSAMTLFSRVLGMARDVVSANLFGIGKVWDGFVFAFMIPNFLRRLLGEGALTGAFVPLYSTIREEYGEKEANYFANLILSLLLMGLGVLFILGSLAITLILHMTTLPQRLELVFGLLQLFLPYILILCLLAVVISVLNCRKHFFLPSLQPVILNVVWILAIVFVCRNMEGSLEGKAYGLAAAIFLSGLLQFLLLSALLYREGFRYRFSLNLRYKYLGKLGSLMIPAAIGFSITQVNILVDLLLSYLIGEGASSSLWYGNRLMQFPLGLFGIAVGTVLLPTLSDQAAAKKFQEMKETLSFSMRTVLMAIIPATVGLIMLSYPITRLLFQSGLFDVTAAQRTALAVAAYALGLFAYSGIKLLLSCYYSFQDTKTPVVIGSICMLLNIGLNLFLMRYYREAGLALATSISNTLNFIVLFLLLEKRIGKIEGIFKPLVKICVACAGMAVLVHFSFRGISFSFIPSEKAALLLRVFFSIFVGMAGYYGFCVVLRVNEARKLTAMLWGRIFSVKKAN